ncbi:MAG: FemAB family XrtA/PEP-CTERM system-associated protein [Pseudomonadota bacterium]
MWDGFVAASDAAEPYHPYEWRSVFERVFGHNCIYLTARNEGGDVVGILPLVQLRSRLFGNFLVSVPCFNYCGALAQDAAVLQELVAAAWRTAEELGASHVEMRHSADVKLELPYRDDKVAMRLRLPESSDELWKGFSSKLRAQIRRPTKAGAICEQGGLELLDDFYAVFSRNMRDLGTPVFPKDLFRQMCESFPEQTRLFVVRIDGQAAAAGVTYGFRDRLEIPSASSLREYNKVSVNMLLYWTVLQYAIDSGYRVFDFGRSTADAGTYRFKKQWGAEPASLHWHYCLRPGDKLPALNPQNARFRLATKMWQRLPLAVANSLGPRIVRNLP